MIRLIHFSWNYMIYDIMPTTNPTNPVIQYTTQYTFDVMGHRNGQQLMYYYINSKWS
jgi:hypothetical protein